MTRRDLRLLPLAGGAWSAALVSVFFPAAAWWVAGIGTAIAIALTGVAFRRGGTGIRGGIAILILVFAAAVAASVGFAAPDRSAAAAWDGRVVEATADITSSASIGRDGRLWFEAQLSGIGPPGRPGPAAAPVRIGIDPADGFDLGASIRVTGEAEATDPGERSALIVYTSTAELVRPASGVFDVAAGARMAFVERSTLLPEPGSGLLPGLAVGDTRAVSVELNDDMRTSGLSHLTAVSGANCAIVVGAVFWLTALCGGGRGLRIALASVALAGFVILVTPEPSVIRAATMAGFAMLTILLGRPSAGAGMLALCAIGILIADPWLASTPGFALSVAASGALILLARPLARGLERWIPSPLALALGVPLSAQLVCGPIIALFAEQQSLVGVAANLLAAPAAPLATVLGLLACLAAPLPWMADLLAASAWLPAAWIATTAQVSADLPGAELVIVPGIGSALLVALISTALGILLVCSRGLDHPWPLVFLRVGSAGVIAVTLALGGAQLLLRGPLAMASTPAKWSIAACDVGQGDAVLVRSENAVALIDTGPEPEPLADCLRSLGVDRIDLLVLTHFDLDHVGGIDAVQGRVVSVLHGPTDGIEDERLLARLAEDGATMTAAATGVRGQLGGAEWRVLWPQHESAAFPSGNDASVVVEFAGGGVPRSLFLGDLAAPPQRMLARTTRIRGPYAVVKVAHHGSADQDAGLYAALAPAVALVTVGEGNDYGHPRSETLALLKASGAHVLRTDERGRILLGLRDGRLEVWTEQSVGAPG